MTDWSIRWNKNWRSSFSKGNDWVGVLRMRIKKGDGWPVDGIGRSLFRRRLGHGKVREEYRNWPRDVAVKCSSKASRGVTAFERRQCRKNIVFFFEEYRSRAASITRISERRQKFRESLDRPCVPSSRWGRRDGEGIEAMSRLYKSESSKLAKIVQVATVSISSEEANRSQARNALLLLGSKADPFERRGVSSIFKEFFANRIRVHGNSFDAVSKARKSWWSNILPIFPRTIDRRRVLIEKVERGREAGEKTRRKSVTINKIIGNASHVARNFPINLRQW